MAGPILYRGYVIYPGQTVFAAYEFHHEDYDGAPDSGDNRCGHATSIADAKSQIDDMEEE